MEEKRAKVSEPALELFAGHGFEATTVAQIGEAAGITERTFFNYFRSKIDAIFPRAEYQSFMSLQTMVAEQPPELDDVETLCACGFDWLRAELSVDPLRHHRSAAVSACACPERSVIVLSTRAAAQRRMTAALTQPGSSSRPMSLSL
ncbi:helix-turn-helix domain-containing protein [Streptomyces sp. NPDC050264]|uniref:TetR/AcrR family transcriptional regulator n=1 Tax=Streptomyces sp. NPDC050264 TaxID=3155038 RepID=UPI00344193C9